ncbi:hypothetical protein BSL78_25778 [Apostichopus japonicus]|uniref:Uncharacterized protein n=1 Tax=Stichopus japonicus TaxID=307972 RepID=A0A2G8JNQ6_STIJA|nr:hypothetical protein BSL78_25778 [Apostichopus japonicus]
MAAVRWAPLGLGGERRSSGGAVVVPSGRRCASASSRCPGAGRAVCRSPASSSESSSAQWSGGCCSRSPGWLVLPRSEGSRSLCSRGSKLRFSQGLSPGYLFLYFFWKLPPKRSSPSTGRASILFLASVDGQRMAETTFSLRAFTERVATLANWSYASLTRGPSSRRSWPASSLDTWLSSSGSCWWCRIRTSADSIRTEANFMPERAAVSTSTRSSSSFLWSGVLKVWEDEAPCSAFSLSLASWGMVGHLNSALQASSGTLTALSALAGKAVHLFLSAMASNLS